MAVCDMCVHQVVLAKLELFSLSELQSPAVLKVKLEYDQQEKERRMIEMQRFESGQYFNYEPQYYPWCKIFTPMNDKLSNAINQLALQGRKEEATKLAKENKVRAGLKLIDNARNGDNSALQSLFKNGRAITNPVTGEISPIYALCARVNSQGQCPLFKPELRG